MAMPRVAHGMGVMWRTADCTQASTRARTRWQHLGTGRWAARWSLGHLPVSTASGRRIFQGWHAPQAAQTFPEAACTGACMHACMHAGRTVCICVCIRVCECQCTCTPRQCLCNPRSAKTFLSWVGVGRGHPAMLRFCEVVLQHAGLRCRSWQSGPPLEPTACYCFGMPRPGAALSGLAAGALQLGHRV